MPRVKGRGAASIYLRLGGAAEAVGRQIGHLSLQILDLEMGVALGGGDPGGAVYVSGLRGDLA